MRNSYQSFFQKKRN